MNRLTKVISMQTQLGFAYFSLSVFGVVGARCLAMRSYSEKGNNGIPCNNPPKKSSLYTKTGDKGLSSLYNGERRPKTDIVFEALGHQDELNAVIGIAREYCELSDSKLANVLAEIQSRLFDLGAAVATPFQTSSDEKRLYTEFSADFTSRLEGWIDEFDAALPPLKNFVIPSGGLCSTHLNLARAVCRRAERSVVPLVHAGQADAQVGIYLNRFCSINVLLTIILKTIITIISYRLSDFLFVASRTAAFREGRTELLWRKAQPNPIVGPM